jgi:hypothetical protein
VTVSLADLALGELEQHIATLPVDAKRIKGLTVSAPITGQVSNAGAVVAGSGFTAASAGTGLYTVTFTAAFAVNPTVIVTAVMDSNQRVANLLNLATTSFDVNTRNDAGSLANGAFHFVAYVTV